MFVHTNSIKPALSFLQEGRGKRTKAKAHAAAQQALANPEFLNRDVVSVLKQHIGTEKDFLNATDFKSAVRTNTVIAYLSKTLKEMIATKGLKKALNELFSEFYRNYYKTLDRDRTHEEFMSYAEVEFDEPTAYVILLIAAELLIPLVNLTTTSLRSANARLIDLAETRTSVSHLFKNSNLLDRAKYIRKNVDVEYTDAGVITEISNRAWRVVR